MFDKFKKVGGVVPDKQSVTFIEVPCCNKNCNEKNKKINTKEIQESVYKHLSEKILQDIADDEDKKLFNSLDDRLNQF